MCKRDISHPRAVCVNPNNSVIIVDRAATFDASTSYDPDSGDVLTFIWTSDVIGEFYEGPDSQTTHTFADQV